jgi:hypothetical protein
MPQFTSIYAFMLAALELPNGNYRVTPAERIAFEKRGALIKFTLFIDDEAQEERIYAVRGEEIEKYFEELERLYS